MTFRSDSIIESPVVLYTFQREITQKIIQQAPHV